MKRCKECKAQYPDDAQFCPVEGSVLEDVVGTVASDQIIENKFRLGKVLGGNRTGTVYQAFRISDESIFALKLVHKKVFPTPILASRAQRELKNLTKVNSAQVAKIQDFGLHKACIWFAMEICPEKTLAEVLSERKLSLEESLDIVEQISKGLEAAAKAGVIHRDLSPKNILVDDKDKVSLINFCVPVKGKEHTGVTGYMAPEQLKSAPPDLRSNVYSLATILYQCLEGKRAFIGDYEAVLLGQDSHVSFDVCKEENIELAIKKALDTEPSNRFMTFREMVKALRSPTPKIKENIAMSKNDDKANTEPSKNKTLMGFASPEVAKLKKEIDAKKKEAEAKTAAVAANAIGTPAPISKRKPGKISAPPPIPKNSLAKTKLQPQGMAQSNPEPEEIVESAKSQSVEPKQPPLKTAEESKDMKSTKKDKTSNKKSVDAKPNKAEVADNDEKSVKEKAAKSGGLAAPVLAAPKVVKETVGLKKPQIGKNAGGKGKAKATENVPEPQTGEKKGKFRETMWFKKGELDEAAAEAASEKRKKDELASDKVDEMAIDERYNDDGTITDHDKERLSLRTGSTMMEPVKNVVNRNDVSEHDLISEMKGNRTKVFAGVAAGVVLLLIVLAFVF